MGGYRRDITTVHAIPSRWFITGSVRRANAGRFQDRGARHVLLHDPVPPPVIPHSNQDVEPHRRQKSCRSCGPQVVKVFFVQNIVNVAGLGKSTSVTTLSELKPLRVSQYIASPYHARIQQPRNPRYSDVTFERDLGHLGHQPAVTAVRTTP
jgi:hypothetical protein